MAKKRATAAQIKERVDREQELSKRGWGIEEIGKEVGVTHQQVSKDLRKRLRETADTEDAEELRTMMNMRLNDLIQTKYEAALAETGSSQNVTNTLLNIYKLFIQINGIVDLSPNINIYNQTNYFNQDITDYLIEQGFTEEQIERWKNMIEGRYADQS